MWYNLFKYRMNDGNDIMSWKYWVSVRGIYIE